MPLDTHAAFRELENGGFDAKQAEVLVQVINDVMGAQATKADIGGVRAGLEKRGEDFKAGLEKRGEDFKAGLEKRGEDFKAALEKRSKDFKEHFATKADVRAATNRNLLDTLAVAAVLFTALQVFS